MTNTLPNPPVLHTNYVDETVTNGTVVSRISVSDPDGDALNVSIVDALGDTDLVSAFELVYDPVAGNYKLVVRDASKINFEAVGGTLNLRIKVADATQSVIKDFAITIVDVNEAPTNIFLSHRAVEEHAAAGTWIADLSGTDQDSGDVLTYTLKDAASSPFEIVRNAAGVYQLRVKDGSLIDYASDLDKKIDVTVIATDKNGLAVEKTFSLDIVDVNHAPTDIQLYENGVIELTEENFVIGQFAAEDIDAGETFTYTLLDDAGGRFKLNGDLLLVKDGFKLDYEQQTAHEVLVRVTDVAGKSFDKTLTINVMDWLNEHTLGSDANDRFSGGTGADRLGGGKGDDTLSGSYSTDILTGGEGRDVFVFDTRAHASNRDVIVDFTEEEDKISLKGPIFKLNALIGGPLTADKFCLGTAATDFSQRILYDIATGKLLYDGDGSGAAEAVEIATFSNKPLLSVSDFLVVA